VQTGLHYVVPFIERVSNNVSLKEIVKDFAPQPVITKDNVVWDMIEDNTYKLTKAITKYSNVKFYIWLTKDEQDFRSEEKLLIFNDNTNVEKEIEPEEIDRN